MEYGTPLWNPDEHATGKAALPAPVSRLALFGRLQTEAKAFLCFRVCAPGLADASVRKVKPGRCRWSTGNGADLVPGIGEKPIG